MRLCSLALVAVVSWTLPALADEQTVPMGTGRVFLGGHLGTTLRQGEQRLNPEFGLHLTGPLIQTGPRFGLEWLATVEPRANRWNRNDTYGTPDNPVTTGSRGFELQLIAVPGARVLLPVRRRFLVHLDASLGPAVTYSRERYYDPDGADLRRLTHWWMAYRVAAGAVMPYSERLRFSFTPFALQNHSNGNQGRLAVSVQLGLDFALN